MKRTATAIALVILLLVSAVSLEFVTTTVADPFPLPEEAPSGCRIYSNGTYTVENLHQNGNVYTFTDDVDGTIVIERDDIVLDGAGYALRGSGVSSGIWLQDRNNVTIKNVNIRNFDNGIRFSHYHPSPYSLQENPYHTADCTISACNITNCAYGISLISCLDCNITNNFLTNNTYGVNFYGSGNIFRHNRMEQNQYNFFDQSYGENDVDTSNIVNGKPIYCWVNKTDTSVPNNAALVILKDCRNITIKNLELRGNGYGVSLRNTNDSKIYENSICDNVLGIIVSESCNNSLLGNDIEKNLSYGIHLRNSCNNTVSNNLLTANEAGVQAYSSNNNLYSNNQIIDNNMSGIYDDSSCDITGNYVFGNKNTGISVGSNCIISRNNITSNGPKTSAFQGAGMYFTSNCTITDNYVVKNNFGIWTYDGKGNIITGNTIAFNNNEGVRFHGPAENNLVYHNNIFDNNNGGAQVFVKSPVPNSWDNGAAGNYWGEYTPTPYVISDKNQDNHPLLAPIAFAPLELPLIQLPAIEDTPEDTVAKQTETPSSLALIIALIAAAIAFACVGFVIYFKKHKRKAEPE
jgi:parallel beta-helix repeat protein